jgi:hypothetical protein
MKQVANRAWLSACFVLVSRMSCFSNLNMDAMWPSEMSVGFFAFRRERKKCNVVIFCSFMGLE